MCCFNCNTTSQLGAWRKLPILMKCALSSRLGSCSISSSFNGDNIKGKYSSCDSGTWKCSINSATSTGEIIKVRSLRKMAAISRIAKSVCRYWAISAGWEISTTWPFFIALCRASRRLCKSSVFNTRNALGQNFSTRQPNCSSIIKRSKITMLGFNSVM